METTVSLFRLGRSDQGTEGILSAGSFLCYTLELPWRENRTGISCIPAGTYNTTIRMSPRFGKIYHVTEVRDRQLILIHSGNYAGDTARGFRTHVQGCILLGKYRGILDGQKAILNSRLAVTEFMRFMNDNPFQLTIKENF